MNWKQKAIAEIATQIKAQGYRPFIAERGDYGFFTDLDGKRVVCFDFDLGGANYSGNYKTSAPQSTGTGWSITSTCYSEPDCNALFNATAPQWAINGATWRYTTLAEHLKTYQSSSRYVEFIGEQVAA